MKQQLLEFNEFIDFDVMNSEKKVQEIEELLKNFNEELTI